MKEIWKPIPGLPTCYEISSLGRVRSYRYKRQKVRLINPILLNPSKRGKNKKYLAVQLTLEEGKRQIKWFSISRLVLLTFVGKPPKGMEAAHNDGNTFNNKLTNLRWTTPVKNAADKLNHGTHIHGSKTKTAKLIESEVTEIRERYFSGNVSQRDLAAEYQVSQRTIFNIVNNNSWRFID
jgi:hypothetical protein